MRREGRVSAGIEILETLLSGVVPPDRLLTAKEAAARYPDAWAAREADRWHHQRLGGESFAQLAARIGAFLRDAEGDAIVVSHGAAGRVLRGLYGRLAHDEILALDEPQDAIFRLTQGTVARFDHERESGAGGI